MIDLPVGESLINITSKTDLDATYNLVAYYDGKFVVNEMGEILDRNLINAYMKYDNPNKHFDFDIEKMSHNLKSDFVEMPKNQTVEERMIWLQDEMNKRKNTTGK